MPLFPRTYFVLVLDRTNRDYGMNRSGLLPSSVRPWLREEKRCPPLPPLRPPPRTGVGVSQEGEGGRRTEKGPADRAGAFRGRERRRMKGIENQDLRRWGARRRRLRQAPRRWSPARFPAAASRERSTEGEFASPPLIAGWLHSRRRGFYGRTLFSSVMWSMSTGPLQSV